MIKIHPQSSYSGLLSKRWSSRSCLKFRGGNDNRNWIHLPPTEVISNAILFVYPLYGALAKKARACHLRWRQFALKIAHLAIFMDPNPLLEKVCTCGLLPLLWLLLSDFISVFYFFFLLREFITASDWGNLGSTLTEWACSSGNRSEHWTPSPHSASRDEIWSRLFLLGT